MMMSIYILCYLYSIAPLLLSKTIKADIVASCDGYVGSETFSDMELSFSRPLYPETIHGAMVEANPSDACNNISLPPQANFSVDWLVLVAGNNCSYDTKLYHAQSARYSAVIIYNLEPKDTSLKHSSSELNITAVVVKTASGLRLKEKYLFTVDERCKVYLIPNKPMIINGFFYFIGIVFGVPILTILVFLIRDAVYQTLINRLSSQQLSQLTTSKFKKGDSWQTCAICLEDYKENEKLRILPCLHGYHAKCIDPWLKNNRTCPVCKQIINLDGEALHHEQSLSESDTDSDTESRAEAAPLLQSGRNVNVHGTFSTGIFVMSDNQGVNSNETSIDDTSYDFESCTEAMKSNRNFTSPFST